MKSEMIYGAKIMAVEITIPKTNIQVLGYKNEMLEIIIFIIVVIIIDNNNGIYFGMLVLPILQEYKSVSF